MELKRRSLTYKISCNVVLIVPSGIETPGSYGCNRIYQQVLIVPSGIETGISLVADSQLTVLIVPSGIETIGMLHSWELPQ